ncbi:MAG: hypothetical protein IJN03_00130 [Bacilli bacterium]|nr:hypothetical protein [Bacilli bacterium]
MEFLLSFLPIVIYFLLIIILIIGIIFGLKAIKTMDKVDKIVDNVNEKMESLDSMFNIIDFITEKLSTISDKVVDFISSWVSKLWFQRSKKNIKEEEIEDYE